MQKPFLFFTQTISTSSSGSNPRISSRASSVNNRDNGDGGGGRPAPLHRGKSVSFLDVGAVNPSASPDKSPSLRNMAGVGRADASSSSPSAGGGRALPPVAAAQPADASGKPPVSPSGAAAAAVGEAALVVGTLANSCGLSPGAAGDKDCERSGSSINLNVGESSTSTRSLEPALKWPPDRDSSEPIWFTDEFLLERLSRSKPRCSVS